MDSKKKRAFLSGGAALVGALLGSQPASAIENSAAAVTSETSGGTAAPDFILQPANATKGTAYQDSHGSHASHASHASHSSHSSHYSSSG